MIDDGMGELDNSAVVGVIEKLAGRYWKSSLKQSPTRRLNCFQRLCNLT
jgi:hypothetical protein